LSVSGSLMFNAMWKKDDSGKESALGLSNSRSCGAPAGETQTAKRQPRQRSRVPGGGKAIGRLTAGRVSPRCGLQVGVEQFRRVPAAGKLSVSGKGLSTVSKNAKGRETVALTVQVKRRGRFKTKLKLLFTPAHGERQAKSISMRG
jgi:hypothetical protein